MNAWAWAAEAVAAIPVFNLSILADSDKAKAQFYQAYYDYINTLQQAFQDVDDSLSERAANAKILKTNYIFRVNSKQQKYSLKSIVLSYK